MTITWSTATPDQLPPAKITLIPEDWVVYFVGASEVGRALTLWRAVERNTFEETQELTPILPTVPYRAALTAMNNTSAAADSLMRLQ